MLKAVIFDFDDTLIHTFEHSVKDLRSVSNKFGLELPSEKSIQKNWGKTYREFVKSVWPEIGIDKFEKMRLSMSHTFNHHPPVKGVHEVIDILSKNYVIGIVTGGPREHFMKKAIEAKIDLSRFSFIMTADDNKYSKSDSRFFDKACNELAKLGISKNETLFVGDSIYDFDIAKNTGLHFAGVLTGPACKDDLESAGIEDRMIIPSVMELPVLIRNNGF